VGQRQGSLEGLAVTRFGDRYRGRRVLITGHTGFKGAWLAEWLLGLGAEVTGLALPPPTQPALFEQLGLAQRLRHHEGDVGDLGTVQRVVADSAPDFIFHLAAQPLVRRSYAEPVETYRTNVMGTVHLLEAVRLAGRPCTVVCITTDKAYENREWLHGYREEDPMGGHDPYSSSKGAAELVISAYRRSYFSAPGGTIQVASARAGNVIGGGDWAEDRIVPDCIRSLKRGEPIRARNPQATRPWQHVLEPLSGYLALGASLDQAKRQQDLPRLARLTGAFNFGPPLDSNRPVRSLVAEILRHWPGSWTDQPDVGAVHEANLLNLATDKAHHLLGWHAVWDFGTTLAKTVRWYRQHHDHPVTAGEITRQQIQLYCQQAAQRGLGWAT
jgi:CDP-glucose 4,6-dehydratase